jgi:hypothetical protein
VTSPAATPAGSFDRQFRVQAKHVEQAADGAVR